MQSDRGYSMMAGRNHGSKVDADLVAAIVGAALNFTP